VNRLAGASSLYLRQHAENPVDWWQFGDEAFAEARRRDVPILLSIGYAACHWCHVMAHESFEDEAIAALVNELTVPVKVDREERPDVDSQYMAATQAMTGHGGWPMTVFLTPDGRPFFTGTYFPPVARHGQPSFGQILTSVADVWSNQRDEVLGQADRLADAVRAEASFVGSLVSAGPPPGARARLAQLVDSLAARFEPHGAGFSAAPKFPHPTWIEACVAAWSVAARADARDMAVATLDAMARGGLFDHVAGGFARYSVDAHWDVPHFEKMLTDQALLARAYLRASTWLAHSEFEWVARRTLDFVLDEMRIDGGYASAIDADADGVEGAHVVLRASEVRRVLDAAALGHLADATIERYGLSDLGPLDGACVPRLESSADLAGTRDDDAVRAALRAARATGPLPAIDDKVLLESNAMLASVLAEAAWRLDEPRYGTAAAALVAALAATHRAGETWQRRSGADAPFATSADLAWLLDAHTALFELDGDASHLDDAAGVARDLIAGYWDGEVPTAMAPDRGGGLFQSHRDARGLLVRGHDVLDGAVPSGTSQAAVALARLGMLRSDRDVLAIARRLVALCEPLLDAQPTAAAALVEAACLLDVGVEVAVPGSAGPMLAAVRRSAPPFCVVAFGLGPLELLVARREDVCYVCRGATCDAPVSEVGSVAAALAAAARWEADS
jgi:uncharacterized protein YyaL (SSP411 family)